MFISLINNDDLIHTPRNKNRSKDFAQWHSDERARKAITPGAVWLKHLAGNKMMNKITVVIEA